MALFAAIALLLCSGCFPGRYQLDKLEQAQKHPIPTKSGASKATPHNYGAPQPMVFIFDAGGGG
jgi:hypothetical protein